MVPFNSLLELQRDEVSRKGSPAHPSSSSSYSKRRRGSGGDQASTIPLDVTSCDDHAMHVEYIEREALKKGVQSDAYSFAHVSSPQPWSSGALTVW